MSLITQNTNVPVDTEAQTDARSDNIINGWHRASPVVSNDVLHRTAKRRTADRRTFSQYNQWLVVHLAGD
ncbi:hypothetical protein J6590_073410 [Homalodisca vitripennis]|nr:hypothetical protein J6590_073410 [Homalodisca vitripennis]